MFENKTIIKKLRSVWYNLQYGADSLLKYVEGGANTQQGRQGIIQGPLQSCRVQGISVCRVQDISVCRVQGITGCRVQGISVCRVQGVSVCRVQGISVCRVWGWRSMNKLPENSDAISSHINSTYAQYSWVQSTRICTYISRIWSIYSLSNLHYILNLYIYANHLLPVCVTFTSSM